jgi:oligopeptide/dipeptide ABC transporter ATP-binding protein
MGTRRELISIPGFPPSLIDPPPGCPFAERCPFAESLCREQTPALEEVEPAHFSACHRASAVEEIRAKSREEGTWHNE